MKLAHGAALLIMADSRKKWQKRRRGKRWNKSKYGTMSLKWRNLHTYRRTFVSLEDAELRSWAWYIKVIPVKDSSAQHWPPDQSITTKHVQRHKLLLRALNTDVHATEELCGPIFSHLSASPFNAQLFTHLPINTAITQNRYWSQTSPAHQTKDAHLRSLN